MTAARALNSIADKIRSASGDTGDLLRGTANTAARGMQDTAAMAADTARAAANSSAGVANDAIALARDVGREIYETAADSAGGALTQIERTVRKNPLGALAAAFGVGILIAMMSRR